MQGCGEKTRVISAKCTRYCTCGSNVHCIEISVLFAEKYHSGMPIRYPNDVSAAREKGTEP